MLVSVHNNLSLQFTDLSFQSCLLSCQLPHLLPQSTQLTWRCDNTVWLCGEVSTEVHSHTFHLLQLLSQVIYSALQYPLYMADEESQ